MERLQTKFKALGSLCELQLIGESRKTLEDAARKAVAELERIEVKYSRYRDESIVSRINQAAGSGRKIPVDEETARLLDYADTAFRESGGLFDITSGVLRRAWNFREQKAPEQDELAPLLELVGWRLVSWQAPHIALPREGMELDFGGFGKEYAADRVADLCRRAGVRHGLVDLGGDLCVVGPHPDGSPWMVGIRDPSDPARALASLPLSHGSIATSGDYERFIEIDGKRYSHLLDPRTGWPVQSLAGVTVVADRSLIAGTASTVAMLKGSAAPRWLARLGLPHLWIDRAGRRGGSLWPGQDRAAEAHSRPAPRS